MPTDFYSVSPDVVTKAIELLCWVVGVTGTGIAILCGGLIKALLYIWHKADSRMTNIEGKMDKIAENIEGMDKATAVEISGIKLRCALIHPDNPHAQIRTSDLGVKP